MKMILSLMRFLTEPFLMKQDPTNKIRLQKKLIIIRKQNDAALISNKIILKTIKAKIIL